MYGPVVFLWNYFTAQHFWEVGKTAGEHGEKTEEYMVVWHLPQLPEAANGEGADVGVGEAIV